MDEARIVVSFKADDSHGAPLLVFRGDTPGDLAELIRQAYQMDLLAKVRQVGVHFRAAGADATDEAMHTIRRTFPQAEVVQDQPPWQDAGPDSGGYGQGQQLPRSAGGRQCGQCGNQMQYKEGVNRQGKSYKGYFCAQQGHPVQWVN